MVQEWILDCTADNPLIVSSLKENQVLKCRSFFSGQYRADYHCNGLCSTRTSRTLLQIFSPLQIARTLGLELKLDKLPLPTASSDLLGSTTW